MKKLLLALLLLLPGISLFSQTLPGPSSGNWILLDTTYQLGSYTAGESEMLVHFNNTTTTKVTGVQFRVFFDTAAFQNPVVTSTNASWSQHLSYHVVGNHISVAMTYTGSSATFAIPNGDLVKITFDHKTAFPTLTSISATTFNGSPAYTTVSSTQNGTDTTLAKHSYGATWEFPEFNFAANFENVNNLPVKHMHVSLEKRVKNTTTWSQVDSDTTNSLGWVSFNAIIDTTYYDTRMVVRGDTMDASASISIADAHQINKFVTGENTPYGFDYYTSDVNASNDISISDAYVVFGRLANRFNSWINNTPDLKFFTQSQYNTIFTDSTTNYTSTIPGADTIYFNITPGVDTVKYYVATPGDANGTGFNVARIIPVKVINPNAAPNWVIDYQLEYPGNDKSIEVRLPKFENIEEGNLVNVPLTVNNMGHQVGSLQFGVFYDPDLLSFSSIIVSEKASKWLSYTNPSDNVVEWGGYDPSQNQNLIQQENDFVTLQFIAQKPKNEWGISPLYVVNKSSGNQICQDLNMIPTEGVAEIVKMVNISPTDIEEVKCYPNPTSDQTNFEFKRKTFGFTELTVMNAQGQVIDKVFKENLPIGAYRYTVDLSGYTEGFYYLIVSSSKETDSTKVVLQK